MATLALVLLSGCARDRSTDAAVDPQSAQRGKAVADRMCALCHEVTPGRPTGIKDAGPGFALIANTSGRDRSTLARFLGERHDLGKINMAGTPMPTILLTPSQRDDVISYILAYQLDPHTGNQPPIGLRLF